MDTQHPKDILDRQETAKAFVAAYYNSHTPGDPERPFTLDASSVYVVWFCKTRLNWKALLSTPIDDGRYYEATYDGNTGELYLTVYKQVDNVTIKEELVGGHFEDTGFHTVEIPGHKLQVMQTQQWVPESKSAGPKAPGCDWDMHPDDVDPENAGIHGVKNMKWGDKSSDIPMLREKVYPKSRTTDHYTEL